jgi:DNA adenine methylase
MSLNAPFPWFGGKSRASALIWSRLGDVDSYNEPFAGSLAVLLQRPHAPRIETVNDLDCYISNFWRALRADPDQVAYWADYPVNETDLHARHRWLVDRVEFRARMQTDPDYFDAKIAGWWVWGQCLWIGSGWCQVADEAREDPSTHKKRPHADRGAGKGVHRQFDRNGKGTTHQARRPHLTSDQGIARRRWQGGGAGGGSGVHAPRLTQQKPDLSGDSGAAGRGVHAVGITRRGGLYEYLGDLAARLRRVRVCCGDWERVLTRSVTTYIGVTGVTLDPPYSHELRERCYSEDHDVSADVRRWALEHGDDPLFRIALCGYEGEHEMPQTWECVPWKAKGGYSRSARGVANRELERVWFSPHCMRPGDRLF